MRAGDLVRITRASLGAPKGSVGLTIARDTQYSDEIFVYLLEAGIRTSHLSSGWTSPLLNLLSLLEHREKLALFLPNHRLSLITSNFSALNSIRSLCR